MKNEDATFDILTELDRIETEKTEYLKRKIEEAKQIGKEDFDIEYLKKNYWRQGLMCSGMQDGLSEDVIESYRSQYYMTYTDVMTMDEFVKKLEQQDMYFE